jgi:RNA polymerase sigma factor, sigma-70 family
MLSRIEEIKLIALCVTTDNRRAFARLVNEYSPMVRNFLFRLTGGDAVLTDDLSQDTFLKAYSSLKSFKAMARFSTWLMRIAYNEFVDYSRRRRESLLPPDTSAVDFITEGSDSDSRLAEIRHDLHTAMAALSPVERSLIVLFYYDDRPIKEICAITSLPEGPVKSYLSRAKSKMAKLLKNDEL